jgi:hypothetical protein
MSYLAPGAGPRPAARGGTRWAGYATWTLLGLAVAFSLARTRGATDDFQDANFGAYYRAGQAVARGESPYRLEEHGPTAAFVYAPAYAYLFSPLSRLDYAWAVRLWTLLNWACCAGCVVLGWTLVGGGDPPGGWDWGKVWLGGLPLAGYFWANVRVGQAGALMGALCLGWAVCQRRGRPFLGGLLLAAAVALKVAPVVLLPYLLVRRDRRGLAGALTGAAAFFALPALWVGWEGSLRLHLEWPRLCQSTQALETCTAQNQSLLAVLARSPAVSDGNTVYSADNLGRLENAYPLVVLALAALCYGWIWWQRRAGDLAPGREKVRDNVHLAVLLIVTALVSPRAWPCNFVVAIVALFLLTDEVCRRSPGWIGALAALSLVGVVSAIPRSHDPAAHWSWGRWVYQAKDFLALVTVAGATVWFCARRLRPGDRPGSVSPAVSAVLQTAP